MKLLALDPSTTCTGYAVMRSSDDLFDAGIIRPPTTAKTPLERIESICKEVAALIAEIHPHYMVIEVPSGHVAARIAEESGGAGLSVYGMAVGAVVHTAWIAMGSSELVWTPDESWTQGIAKQVRRLAIMAEFSWANEQFEKDSGSDMADAIGLAQWWFTNQSLQQLAEGA